MPSSILPDTTCEAFPDLPTDVGRRIFEVLALLDRSAAFSLVYVCKMVREWITPILYTDICLTNEAQISALAETMRSRVETDPLFFHRCVKSLSLAPRGFPDTSSHANVQPKEDILFILQCCSSITSLGYASCGGPPSAEVFFLGGTYPRRWTGFEKDLFPIIPPSTTHISAKYLPLSHGHWETLLQRTTHLTHVLLDHQDSMPNFMGSFYLQRVPSSLKRIVIVLSIPRISEVTLTRDASMNLVKMFLDKCTADPRVVFVGLTNGNEPWPIVDDMPGLALVEFKREMDDVYLQPDWTSCTVMGEGRGVGVSDIWELAEMAGHVKEKALSAAKKS